MRVGPLYLLPFCFFCLSATPDQSFSVKINFDQTGNTLQIKYFRVVFLGERDLIKAVYPYSFCTKTNDCIISPNTTFNFNLKNSMQFPIYEKLRNKQVNVSIVGVITSSLRRRHNERYPLQETDREAYQDLECKEEEKFCTSHQIHLKEFEINMYFKAIDKYVELYKYNSISQDKMKTVFTGPGIFRLQPNGTMSYIEPLYYHPQVDMIYS